MRLRTPDSAGQRDTEPRGKSQPARWGRPPYACFDAQLQQHQREHRGRQVCRRVRQRKRDLRRQAPRAAPAPRRARPPVSPSQGRNNVHQPPQQPMAPPAAHGCAAGCSQLCMNNPRRSGSCRTGKVAQVNHTTGRAWPSAAAHAMPEVRSTAASHVSTNRVSQPRIGQSYPPYQVTNPVYQVVPQRGARTARRARPQATAAGPAAAAAAVPALRRRRRRAPGPGRWRTARPARPATRATRRRSRLPRRPPPRPARRPRRPPCAHPAPPPAGGSVAARSPAARALSGRCPPPGQRHPWGRQLRGLIPDIA